MKWFTVYGASDDLVELEVTQEVGGALRTRSTEVDVSPSTQLWVGSVWSPSTDERLRVSVWFADVWFAGVGQAAEGHLVPSWPVRFEADMREPDRPGYATRLVIEVPDDAVLTGSGLVEGLR